MKSADAQDESGLWIIPEQLDLGVISEAEAHFSIELAVPVPCRLTSRVQGVDFDPPALTPGINAVQLKVADVPRDTILWGMVELSGAGFMRELSLYARVAVTSPGSTAPVVKLHHLTLAQAAAFTRRLHPPAPEPEPEPAAAIEPERPKLSTPLAMMPVKAVAPANTHATPLSHIFAQPEPELPALVVQPELPPVTPPTSIFSPNAEDEASPDEKPTQTKPLLSNLFTEDPP